MLKENVCFADGPIFRVPDLFLGVYQCGMNRISPKSRYSENNLNSSDGNDLYDSQINTDVTTPNLDQSTEPTQLKSEEGESCDKCGRREIPIQIKYDSHEPTDSPKRKNKNATGLKKEMEDLKTRMEYFEIRFGCIEKALFSKKE